MNARTALKGIALGNGWEAELAVWGRNLTDDDNIAFTSLNTNVNFYATTFTEERSYGVDLIVKY